MSADNGIYILRTKDGYRVSECQAIENIYWWPTCCDFAEITEEIEIVFDAEELGGNFPQDVDICYREKCVNCGQRDPEWEQREEINPQVLFRYFHDSDVFKTREEALDQADFLYCQANKDACCGVEYGIQFINGLEKVDFPKKG